MFDGRSRHYKGSPGVTILAHPFAQFPTMPNSNSGNIDLTLTDLPTYSFITNGSGAYATLNAAATANIGANSDLQVDYCSASHQYYTVGGNDIARLFQ